MCDLWASFPQKYGSYMQFVFERERKIPFGSSLSVWLTKDKGQIWEHLSWLTYLRHIPLVGLHPQGRSGVYYYCYYFFVFSFFTTASFFKGIGLLFSFRIIKETIENHEWSSGQQTVVSTETHNQSEVREYVSVEYSATHETLPSPLPKAQRSSWKKKQKESTSHRLGGLGQSSVFKT